MSRTQINVSLLNPINGTFIGMGRNRIINGDMQVDQRNSGSSVPISTSTLYTVDRMVAAVNASPTGTWTVQQQTATPPSGFATYIRATVGTAQASPSATQIAILETILEGNTTNDFQYGTSGAVNAVLSFWVRSSLTGTFGGVVKNTTGGKSFPFNYSIPSANTWTQITVSVPGDTASALGTGINVGFQIVFIGLMVGSTFQGTPTGAWQSGNYFGTTTGTNILATSGATFDVTGIQFEIGNTATTFESLSYGFQLFRCQRYYQAASYYWSGYMNTGGFNYGYTVLFPATMRTTPTVVANFTNLTADNGSTTCACVAGVTFNLSLYSFSYYTNPGTNNRSGSYTLAWTASADF
jgi:hypothetical protein